MKQIKLGSPPPPKKSILFMDDIANWELHDKIICYVPKSNNEDNPKGLAILVSDDSSRYCYGFLYHKSLVTKDGNRSHTFNGKSKKNALKNALKAGREAFIFDSFHEFLQFAEKHSAY